MQRMYVQYLNTLFCLPIFYFATFKWSLNVILTQLNILNQPVATRSGGYSVKTFFFFFLEVTSNSGENNGMSHQRPFFSGDQPQREDIVPPKFSLAPPQNFRSGYVPATGIEFYDLPIWNIFL